MKYVQFDYVNKFSCLAGKCPDTCCKDWQIILDEDAIARYASLPGELGEQVRAAMLTENGETRFRERGLGTAFCCVTTASVRFRPHTVRKALPHLLYAPALYRGIRPDGGADALRLLPGGGKTSAGARRAADADGNGRRRPGHTERA